jgi:RNA polymerase primary sigma factor
MTLTHSETLESETLESETLEGTAERLLQQVFEATDTEATAGALVLIPEVTPTSIDTDAEEVEPTDAELAALSAEEEEALFGKGAGHYGGADGSEDAFQSYLHDIRGLSLLSHDEELTLAKRSAAGDSRARRRLIEANLRLVIAIARRYTNSGVPLIGPGLLRAAGDQRSDLRRQEWEGPRFFSGQPGRGAGRVCLL